MADQTSGDAAPQGMETKNLPDGFNPNQAVPAPVPYSDSTHLERDAAERDQEVGSKQGAQPTGKTETGGTTRKSSTSKS